MITETNNYNLCPECSTEFFDPEEHVTLNRFPINRALVALNTEFRSLEEAKATHLQSIESDFGLLEHKEQDISLEIQSL